MPKKKYKFYVHILWITKSDNTLKSNERHADTELIELTRNIVILKL